MLLIKKIVKRTMNVLYLKNSAYDHGPSPCIETGSWMEGNGYMLDIDWSCGEQFRDHN